MDFPIFNSFCQEIDWTSAINIVQISIQRKLLPFDHLSEFSWCVGKTKQKKTNFYISGKKDAQKFAFSINYSARGKP